jgi:hypothetical protein
LIVSVPDRRRHRGPHPEDARLFAADVLPRLRAAVADLTWLLDRGYAAPSSLKLVGDRYQLVARQRTAAMRATCSHSQREGRRRRELPLDLAAGQALVIDGYNLLTTIESALAGGVILAALDGTYRDLASMHGSYRKVEETAPALDLIGRILATRQISCRWLLDSPVSNSGRLRSLLLKVAATAGWDWQVEVVRNPDAVLRATTETIASADGAVLDHCGRWVNLARAIVSAHIPQAWIAGFADALPATHE